MISETEIQALEASLSWWETAGYVASAFVVVGCIGESVYEFTKWFQHSDTWWKLSGGKISAFTLIAALAFEIPIQFKTNSISGIVIKRLSENAAELYAGAKKSELALERLRAASETRVTALLDRGDFSEALKGEPTGKARFWYVAEDEDALIFCNLLSGFLSQAGWKVIAPTPIPDLPMRTPNQTLFTTATGGLSTGNNVILRCSKLSDWKNENRVVGRLLKSFQKIHFSVSIMPEDMAASFGYPDSIAHNLEEDEILVVVGHKP